MDGNLQQFLDDYFIGQRDIKKEINIIVSSFLSVGYGNLLISGASGYGKTYLARLISKYISHLTGDDINLVVVDDFRNFIVPSKIVIFDEIHTAKNIEFLYPLVDEKKYYFIICTNEYNLSEPLLNRVFTVFLKDYSNTELVEMAIDFGCSNIKMLDKIVANCRGNPRTLKRLVQVVKSEQDIIELGIKDGGFTETDLLYINTLKHIGGTASIKTISAVTKIPEEYIKWEIEPFLIRKGLIKITSKGRSLI